MEFVFERGDGATHVHIMPNDLRVHPESRSLLGSDLSFCILHDNLKPQNTLGWEHALSQAIPLFQKNPQNKWILSI